MIRVFDYLIFGGFFLASALTAEEWKSPSFLLKSAFILFFLVLSRSPKSYRLNWRSSLGILLSFGTPLFFETDRVQASSLTLIFVLAAALFYFGCLIAAYVQLGRSLGVLPQLKEIRTSGLYAYLRHPIYAAYLHLALLGLVLFPSPLNICLLALMGGGLHLRIWEEEKLLSNSAEYRDYKSKVPARLWRWSYTLPLLLATGVAVSDQFQRKPEVRNLNIFFGYAPISLNPLYYDDFGSVFLGNHIYPRFKPDSRRTDLRSVTENFQIQCVDPDCRRQRIRARFKDGIRNCRGQSLEPKILKSELRQILLRKKWIFPDSVNCATDEDEQICLEGPSGVDLDRNFDALYLRFGWSLENEKRETFENRIIGVEPFCLRLTEWNDTELLAGELVPSPRNGGSDILKVSFGSQQSFAISADLSLYGEQPSEAFKLLSTHTPLAYYIVTHPRIQNPKSLPWNQPRAQEVVRNFLLKEGLGFRSEEFFSGLLPVGKALHTSNDSSAKLKNLGSAKFWLPSYLPRCEELSKELNLVFGSRIVQCGNTSYLIEGIQKREERMPWVGFLSPLTPGAPSRDALATQYFSSKSDENWTYPLVSGESHFYLAALGKSLVGVRSDKICSLRPSSLGLGDFMVSDLVWCSH